MNNDIHFGEVEKIERAGREFLRYNILIKYEDPEKNEYRIFREDKVFLTREEAENALKPKWKVGDVCYFLWEDKIIKSSVYDIKIGDPIWVGSAEDYYIISTAVIFRTKQELLDYLDKSCDE